MGNPGEIKVLALMPYKFLPANLGGQKHFAIFFRFFSPLVQSTCVSVKDNDINCAEGYEVLNILQNGKMRYANFFYFFTLRKIIKERKITHLMMEHPYFGWLGILLKKACKVKLVIRSHNIEAERFKSIGKWWWGMLWNYERTVHRFADYSFFIQENDEQYGITKYKLDPAKCSVITYGFELTGPPSNEEREAAKRSIRSTYNIADGEQILLFAGSLNYAPNVSAVNAILHNINPLLLTTGFKYKIIICGGNLAASYNELKEYAGKNIIYAGFVDNIGLFYKGADTLINPVIDGGGIKTKLVEALGYNMNVVTTANGAIGVPLSLTGDKMKITANDDWDNFAQQVIATKTTATISQAFFDHFYWGKIAEKAAAILQSN